MELLVVWCGRVCACDLLRLSTSLCLSPQFYPHPHRRRRQHNFLSLQPTYLPPLDLILSLPPSPFTSPIPICAALILLLFYNLILFYPPLPLPIPVLFAGLYSFLSLTIPTNSLVSPTSIPNSFDLTSVTAYFIKGALR